MLTNIYVRGAAIAFISYLAIGNNDMVELFCLILALNILDHRPITVKLIKKEK